MAGRVESIEGTAAVQGDLWGERARDWAEVMEGWNGWGIPLYRQVLERLDVGQGTDLLDVGCAARVSGIDAAAPLAGALAPPRMSTGGYRIEDELRYLIATS